MANKKVMTDLKEIFKYVNSIDLEKYILFSDLELYNKKTGKSYFYKDYEEVYNDKKIISQIRKITFELQGGRGASSSRGSKLFGDSSGDGEKANTIPLHPAYLNNQGRSVSVEGVIQTFIKKHGDAKREYTTAVDSQGFAHTYGKGEKDTVGVLGINQKYTVIHNHPSGGAFSGADLRTFASLKDMVSAVATNKTKAYRITKLHNFKAKEFEKAVNNAKSSGSDYSKSVDKWLKRNAKKFGYLYEYR